MAAKQVSEIERQQIISFGRPEDMAEEPDLLATELPLAYAASVC